MTHDEMTAALRGPDWPFFDPEDHREIADRLDRYRTALEHAKAEMESANRVALNTGRPIQFSVRWLDEAVK